MIDKAAKDGAVAERLQVILQNWEERRVAAQDSATTAEQQLQARMSERVNAKDTAGKAFSSFFSNRGRNLSYGILAFAGVILVMRILRRLILSFIGVPGNRSFPVRLGSLIYDIATVATAFVRDDRYLQSVQRLVADRVHVVAVHRNWLVHPQIPANTVRTDYPFAEPWRCAGRRTGNFQRYTLAGGKAGSLH